MRISSIFESSTIEDEIHNSAINVGLYRGIDSAIDGPTKVNIRRDRRPLHTTRSDSILFNAAMELQFNIPNIRRTAMFSTTNIDVAHEYAGGHGGCVTEVYVPKTAKLLFDRDVSDSMITCGAITDIVERQEGGSAVLNMLESADYAIDSLEVLRDVCGKVGLGSDLFREICGVIQYKVKSYELVAATPDALNNISDAEVMIVNTDYVYLVPIEEQFDDY